MPTIVTDLAAQHAELETLLRGLEDQAWDRPSALEGWTVADVVLHLAQTDGMALASVQGRFAGFLQEATEGLDPADSVDDGADLMVTRERGAPAADLFERWRSGTVALRAAFDGCDPHTRVVWVAGQLSARTLATTRLAECWIHTGDIGAAFGRSPVPSPRLRPIARLAWRTLPYAFTRAGRSPAGPVAFDLIGPSGEPWSFRPDAEPATVIRGDALELCLVAARRVDPAATGLSGDGPDVDAVLELVRTYA